MRKPRIVIKSEAVNFWSISGPRGSGKTMWLSAIKGNIFHAGRGTSAVAIESHLANGGFSAVIMDGENPEWLGRLKLIAKRFPSVNFYFSITTVASNP